VRKHLVLNQKRREIFKISAVLSPADQFGKEKQSDGIGHALRQFRDMVADAASDDNQIPFSSQHRALLDLVNGLARMDKGNLEIVVVVHPDVPAPVAKKEVDINREFRIEGPHVRAIPVDLGFDDGAGGFPIAKRQRSRCSTGCGRQEQPVPGPDSVGFPAHGAHFLRLAILARTPLAVNETRPKASPGAHDRSAIKDVTILPESRLHAELR